MVKCKNNVALQRSDNSALRRERRQRHSGYRNVCIIVQKRRKYGEWLAFHLIQIQRRVTFVVKASSEIDNPDRWIKRGGKRENYWEIVGEKGSCLRKESNVMWSKTTLSCHVTEPSFITLDKFSGIFGDAKRIQTIHAISCVICNINKAIARRPMRY